MNKWRSPIGQGLMEYSRSGSNRCAVPDATMSFTAKQKAVTRVPAMRRVNVRVPTDP
jgi:hypothetical protein